MIKVKICGINDPVAFDAAVEAGADWIGFVFYPPSPRYVTVSQAAMLSVRVAGGPLRVGLFVEPDEEAIAAILDGVRLDVLQIYGARDRLAAIRARFGVPIWQAIGVSGVEDLPLGSHVADRWVLEAKPPPGANRPGGNATAFDWPLLRGWRATAPWILAGGLRVDNVSDAITKTGADAVDVSSGVESRKGIKDPTLIRSFIGAAKGFRSSCA